MVLFLGGIPHHPIKTFARFSGLRPAHPHSPIPGPRRLPVGTFHAADFPCVPEKNKGALESKRTHPELPFSDCILASSIEARMTVSTSAQLTVLSHPGPPKHVTTIQRTLCRAPSEEGLCCSSVPRGSVPVLSRYITHNQCDKATQRIYIPGDGTLPGEKPRTMAAMLQAVCFVPRQSQSKDAHAIQPANHAEVDWSLANESGQKRQHRPVNLQMFHYFMFNRFNMT